MMMSRSSRLAWAFWAFTLAGCVLPGVLGCGKGNSKSATVSGKVVYKGKPVSGGTLTLYPQAGGMYPVSLRSDGTFSVSGAPKGDMKVTIDTEGLRSMADTKLPKGVSASDMPTFVEIPAIYADKNTTPLTWKIEKGTENKTFELKD